MSMTQEQINVGLFNQIKKMKKELNEKQDTLTELLEKLMTLSIELRMVGLDSMDLDLIIEEYKEHYKPTEKQSNE